MGRERERGGRGARGERAGRAGRAGRGGKGKWPTSGPRQREKGGPRRGVCGTEERGRRCGAVRAAGPGLALPRPSPPPPR
eukprot:1385410-Rhodomonas_salina.1